MIKYLLLISGIFGFKITYHPLEKKIGYIKGINNVDKLSKNDLTELKNLFDTTPLLIFKDVDQLSPNKFINFLTNFDHDCDLDAINYPELYPNQMLQPFDQFPNCKHVAPRGNIKLNNFYNINNINIIPSDIFENNYVWHTDILGHEKKLPNVVSGFYIIEQPLIGGDTDFISGETIYENLNDIEQEASKNLLIEINRNKFITKYKVLDYSGSNRLEEYEECHKGSTQIPLVYAPESDNEKPRILLLPGFFEKIVGMSVEDSRDWIKYFMYNHVLPHRVSIQWKKGDLAVFNNRRFIHSSTPARNYLEFEESSKRLLLQSFLPTKRPLLGIKPKNTDIKKLYNVKWYKNNRNIISSANKLLQYVNLKSINHKQIHSEIDDYYIVKQ
jgi:alpha-ketoglutarate-dependent taurine dioxygenase